MSQFAANIVEDSMHDIPSEKEPLIHKNVLIFISVYAFLALVKDLVTIFFKLTPDPKPLLLTTLSNFDFVFFFFQTTCILLTLFALRSSLNKVYAATRNVVNIATFVWLGKIVINVVVLLFKYLHYSHNMFLDSYSTITTWLTNFSLVLNITLLFCGLLIFFKNKLPYGKIWLGLALVQISNFLINFLLPFFANNGLNSLDLEAAKLITNYVLMILKLFFVFLLLIKYRRYIVNVDTNKL